MTTPSELRASAQVMLGLPVLSEKSYVIDDVERYRIARQLEEAAEALERAEKDAARYRWLRAPANAWRDEWNTFGPYSSPQEIDAAIDSAMGVVSQKTDDAPGVEGNGCTRPECAGQPRCETCCAADAAAGVKGGGNG